MHLRKLGTTNIMVTPLGLGMAALGRPGYITLGHGDDMAEGRDVAAMETRAHEMLDAAFALGVRYFDAARSYGRAEAFLGGWLKARGMEPRDATVGSKWGYTYVADWQVEAETHEVKDHTLATLRRQRGETATELGAHLDLYQIHSATLESGVLDNAEVLTELARLKGEGVAIGLSTSGPRQSDVIERATALTLDGARLFDAVQSTWNILEPSAGAALAGARNAGLGVIVKEALANGRLTSRNPACEGYLSLLQSEAKRLNTTTDAAALAAVLARPWVGVALMGVANPDHLASNLGALDVAWDDEAEAKIAGLAESPEAYWKTRGEMAWN